VRRRIDVVFILILLGALCARVDLARNEAYIHDEENTAIPLSRLISFEPGNLNLPIRAENHGALPAYIVKASGALFGTTRTGYRTLHIMLGLCTVLLIYLVAVQWYGMGAARFAALLLAFNEYFLAISSRATAHVPHLFFMASALYAFSRFLAVQKVAYLYVSGLAVGLAFYCKEPSALLLIVFFVTLLHPRYRQWLRRPQPYLACVLFAAVIAPDLYWNMTTDRELARLPYAEEVGYATYQSHLERIGGFGFSLYPTVFYARDAVMPLYRLVTGKELRDETPEYDSMNPVLGVLLIAAVVLTTFRPAARDDLRRFLLIWFWGVFGFFTLIARGDPPGRLDPVSWIWVEATMLPAMILAGAWLARLKGERRIVLWAVVASALSYAAWIVGD
jgi:4-amino-4-deoxy-L-arabinose transferase-like glycosyltransferase